MHQAGGVDDGNGGVAPVGGAGPGEALMASAVGVLEVPLEGFSRLPSQHQSRQRAGNAAPPSPLHRFPPPNHFKEVYAKSAGRGGERCSRAA